MPDVKKSNETVRDLEPKQDPKGGIVVNWTTTPSQEAPSGTQGPPLWGVRTSLGRG